MKRYYFFRAENVPMNVRSVVYRVAVGISEREQKAYQYMKSEALEQGFTLIPWDESCDFFLDIEMERVFGSKFLVHPRFQRVEMSILNLKAIYRSIGFQFYEKTITQPANSIRQLLKISPTFNLVYKKNVRKAKVFHCSNVNT